MALLVGSVLAAPVDANAQRLIYYEGTVQWIAGSTMVITTDDGWSLRVDLTRVLRARTRPSCSPIEASWRGFFFKMATFSFGRSSSGADWVNQRPFSPPG